MFKDEKDVVYAILFKSKDKVIDIPVSDDKILMVSVDINKDSLIVLATTISKREPDVTAETTSLVVKPGTWLEKAYIKVISESLQGTEYERVYQRLAGVANGRYVKRIFYKNVILTGLRAEGFTTPFDKFLEKVVYATVEELETTLDIIRNEYSRSIFTVVKELLRK